MRMIVLVVGAAAVWAGCMEAPPQDENGTIKDPGGPMPDGDIRGTLAPLDNNTYEDGYLVLERNGTTQVNYGLRGAADLDGVEIVFEWSVRREANHPGNPQPNTTTSGPSQIIYRHAESPMPLAIHVTGHDVPDDMKAEFAPYGKPPDGIFRMQWLQARFQ